MSDEDATELEKMTRYRDRWKLKAITLRGQLADLQYSYEEQADLLAGVKRERERRSELGWEVKAATTTNEYAQRIIAAATERREPNE